MHAARDLLVRGLLAGLLAGIAAFVVAYVVGEPPAGAAIAAERSRDLPAQVTLGGVVGPATAALTHRTIVRGRRADRSTDLMGA